MSTNQRFSFSEEQILQDGARLRQLARRLVADEHEREDLVQEGFLRSLGRLFVDRGHHEKWIRTTLRHLAAEGGRGAANQRARERIVAREEATSSSEDIALRLEAIELVARALRSLREPYRSTLTQIYVDDLSPKQVARLAGVSIEAVHQRKHRGLELMRAELDNRAGGRESWVALCVSLARPSRGGALLAAPTWVAPVAAAACITALVFSVAWIYGTERAAPVIAARGEDASTTSGRAAERVPTGQPGGSRTPIASEEAIEVRVMRSGTLEPVPSATIQRWPLPDGPDFEERIRSWLAQGVLEEKTREGRSEQSADERGLAFVSDAPNGVLVTANRENLWGFVIAEAKQPGPVSLHLFSDSDVKVVVQGEGDLEGLYVAMSALGYWGSDLVTATTNARGEAVLRHAGFASESRRSEGPIALGLAVRGLGGSLAWQDYYSSEENPVVLQVMDSGLDETAYADIRIVDGLTGELTSGEETIYVDALRSGHIRVFGGVATLPIPVGYSVDWEDIGYQVRNPPGAPLQASVAGEHIAITLVRDWVSSSPRVPCGKIIGRLTGWDGRAFAALNVIASSQADPELQGKGVVQASGMFEVEVRSSIAVRQPCDLWLADANGSFLQLFRGLQVAPDKTTALGKVVMPQYTQLVSGMVITHDGPLAGAEIRIRTPEDDQVQLMARTQADGTFEFPEGSWRHSWSNEYILTASHPRFGPHLQEITTPCTGITILLTPPGTVRGQVLLDPNIKSERVWVEASRHESDLGWDPYNNIGMGGPSPCLVRKPIGALGEFELSGLGRASYYLRVVYYDGDGHLILGGAGFQLQEDETVPRELEPIDLRHQFKRAHVTVEDTFGRPVSDAALTVNPGDASNDAFGRGVSSTGSAVLLVPPSARVRAWSKTCFSADVDVVSERVQIVLEPRPRINFALDGESPTIDAGLSLYLRVQDIEGRVWDDVQLDEHGQAHCLAPDRTAFSVKYVLGRNDGGMEEFEERVISLDGSGPWLFMLPPPDPLVLAAATTSLWSRRDE